MPDAEVRRAHRIYETERVGLLDVALRYADKGYYGYRTASDLKEGLRRGFAARGLPMRSKKEAQEIRHERELPTTVGAS